MTNKNSNSLRCRQCGMVNWATDENCRRCHQLLRPSKEPTGSGVSSKTLYIYLIIFIAAVAVPILVGRADPMTGDNLGLLFVIMALGVVLICKLLLLFEMFRESILWGLAGLFLSPLSTLVFAAMHWNRAKGKVFTTLTAFLYCVIMIFASAQMNNPKLVQNTTNPPSAPLTSPPNQMPASKSNFLPPSKNEPTKKIPGK